MAIQGESLERTLTLQSAAAATANGTAIDCKGLAILSVQVTGTFVATVTFEGSVDGTNYVAVDAVNRNGSTVTSTTTAVGQFLVNVAALSYFRARVTWTSGTSVTVVARGSTVGMGLSSKVPGTTISQTPAVTAGAYSANDAVGGLLTFANAAQITGGGGVIKDVIILDDAGQDVELELWLFNATFTAMTNNAAWAPSEADLRKLVAIITSDDGEWFAAGTPSAARVEVSQRYDLTGTSMFGQLVTRGTPTFAATDDVTVIVGLLQD